MVALSALVSRPASASCSAMLLSPLFLFVAVNVTASLALLACLRRGFALTAFTAVFFFAASAIPGRHDHSVLVEQPAAFDQGAAEQSVPSVPSGRPNGAVRFFGRCAQQSRPLLLFDP